MDDYYKDLMDENRINSALSMDREYERVKRIEEGKVKLLENSGVVLELRKQVQELELQSKSLLKQIEILESSKEQAEKQAKKSFIGFVITITISVASLIVAILAIILK